MSYESERLKILEMIDDGLISVEEGVALLKALDQRGAEPEAAPDSLEEPQDNTGLASTSERIIFSTPVQPPSGNIPRGEAFSEEELVGEPSYADGSRVNTESHPSGEKIHAPDPEPPIEEKYPSPQIDQNMRKWKGYWWIPFWVGVGITVLSTSLMYFAWFEGGFGFWFACTWFPFMLGVAVMALAYASRTARWLHVRVHQQPGEKPQNIAISLPIPLRLTAWFFRTFKGHIPQMGNTGIDELIMALEATNPDTPFYVEVDEGEDGERVEVYIG